MFGRRKPRLPLPTEEEKIRTSSGLSCNLHTATYIRFEPLSIAILFLVMPCGKKQVKQPHCKDGQRRQLGRSLADNWNVFDWRYGYSNERAKPARLIATARSTVHEQVETCCRSTRGAVNILRTGACLPKSCSNRSHLRTETINHHRTQANRLIVNHDMHLESTLIHFTNLVACRH